MVETLIAQFRTEVTGSLSDRNRVVDALLDVRLAASNRPTVLVEVDRLLSELPGLTVVPNSWWMSALGHLQRAAHLSAMTTVPPSIPSAR